MHQQQPHCDRPDQIPQPPEDALQESSNVRNAARR